MPDESRRGRQAAEREEEEEEEETAHGLAVEGEGWRELAGQG